MKLAVAAFGLAALVGAGYVIGKKILEKRRDDEEFFELDGLPDEELEALINEGDDDETDVIAGGKASISGKIRNASLFAVGAVKTGAEKLAETVQDIRSKDMVKKGEATMTAVCEAGDNIKNDIKRDIEDLKSSISSIEDEAKDVAGAVDEAAQELQDDIKELFGDDK